MKRVTFIESERFIICQPLIDDITYWDELHSDPDVMKNLGGIRDSQTSSEWIQADISHFKKYGFCLGSVFIKSDMQFVGRAGVVHLFYDDQRPELEIGYALLKKYWHRGFGTEIVKAIIDWSMLKYFDIDLVALTSPDNEASLNLLKAIGMREIKRIIHNKKPFLYFKYDANSE